MCGSSILPVHVDGNCRRSSALHTDDFVLWLEARAPLGPMKESSGILEDARLPTPLCNGCFTKPPFSFRHPQRLAGSGSRRWAGIRLLYVLPISPSSEGVTSFLATTLKWAEALVHRPSFSSPTSPSRCSFRWRLTLNLPLPAFIRI
ncbi:hypothetical protein E1B28_013802 [Marasmius oreades]|uniref:Uncharacterized protein n=1 Tax=Marasmius oreades TaxID=181124 RepID=A0A9P7RQH7_9AGAR|nr:uncharacterized protein E1B28_013802 [Marasmius oreades]KAG7087864.1 hypothetical protein E1B28_013802 [Marasmius oreades]